MKTALQPAASAADICLLSQIHISGQTRGNVSILVPEKQSRQGLFLVAFQVQCGWLRALNQSPPFQNWTQWYEFWTGLTDLNPVEEEIETVCDDETSNFSPSWNVNIIFKKWEKQ